ncbi:glycerophosphodiester phosphodiesterase [Thalassotalea sp. M1531]|uniref:Glycerophosphodiester phosphodiesterase n=1 Tax=Thalassotalea algicola TaxID=2716224 RepID=A0A7Y0L9Z9_9GAMM|nr:glycerophosphodiester phosphodiesterase family protein [Thalassotalea algicola]NMP30517.1 glycerophosphodiester phosphodiesterase [Thalassotalea algicola]
MLVYAHRGASGEFPENTLSAYEQAIIQGADGIELDAQYHKEGHWWILHDLYVDKTTNGQGRLLTLPQKNIETLYTEDDLPILRLEEALSFIDNRCPINIEIKVSSGDEKRLHVMAQNLNELLNDLVIQKTIRWQEISISSFNHLFLVAVADQIPEASIGMLIGHCPADLAQTAQTLGAKTINPCIDCLNKQLVDDAHQRGIAVWVYTVDRFEDIDFCCDIGVDAIFTNFPDRTKKHLISKG